MEAQFRGIIPPVTTPFSEDGAVLYEALERNLDRYRDRPLSGYLLLGSNGEAAHLTDEERVEVVRRARAVIPPDRVLQVGVAAASLRQALAFLEKIEEFAVDAVLVSVPTYYRNRMNAAALVRFFGEVAERSPFPVLLYNVPQYSGLELAAPVVGELAGHDRIVGMKESSGNLVYVERILAATRGTSFQLIQGSAQILGPSLVLGIRAAILAVACALPELPDRVMTRFARGEEIRDEQLRLFEVSNLLTSEFGVPGLKYGMDLAGFEGGWCRLPLLPLEAEERRRIEQALSPYLAVHSEQGR